MHTWRSARARDREVRRAARSIVVNLGLVGEPRAAVVFALAGVILVVAAVRFDPADAQGIDGTLRAFTCTPLVPWLLVLSLLD